MSGANPENPNNINSSSSTSGSSSNSSSDNGNGDGDVCGKGGIECDSNLQLRLYRATMLATPLIFALVLLSLLCMFCIRRCREHPQLLRRRSTHQNHHQSIDMTRVPPQQYGLSKSFRDSLPVVPYNNGLSSSFQDSQCAVCLGDYLQDEKIKHLPACNHCFHVQCIDKWLSTNLTCPICRTPLIRSEEIGNVTEQSNRNRIWEERVTQSQGRVDVVNDMSTIGTPPGNVLIGEVVVVGMDRS